MTNRKRTIRHPDRFQDYEAPKRTDPTKPQYPEKLATQVVPFDPNHEPAAFPSLPLIHDATDTPAPTAQHEVVPSTGEAVESNSVPHSEKVAETHTNVDDHTISTDDEETELPLPKVVTWQALELSCQYLVFNHFVNQGRSAWSTGQLLGLSHGETLNIAKAVNTRRIHPATSEDIAHYYNEAIASGGLETIPQPEGVARYAAFADSYEYISPFGRRMLRQYLKQCGLVDNENSVVTRDAANNASSEGPATIETAAVEEEVAARSVRPKSPVRPSWSPITPANEAVTVPQRSFGQEAEKIVESAPKRAKTSAGVGAAPVPVSALAPAPAPASAPAPAPAPAPVDPAKVRIPRGPRGKYKKTWEKEAREAAAALAAAKHQGGGPQGGQDGAAAGGGGGADGVGVL